MRISTLLLASFTLTAFAANSILCRMALISDSIGPIEFTVIRLGSGILVLLPIILIRKRTKSQHDNEPGLLKMRLSNFWPALTLLGYALFFSLAYIQIDTGVGALVLFASVQITMMGISIILGNRITFIELIGFILSFAGLIYLLLPGLSSPPVLGTVLMIISGTSWGIYSLLGKNKKHPILLTARNFLFCLPGIVLLVIILIIRTVQNGYIQMDSGGVFLAVASGAISSAIGYVLWYITLARITTTVASISQLIVPVLAGLGGIIFLNESVSFRLVIASILIMGGIVIAILGKNRSLKSILEN